MLTLLPANPGSEPALWDAGRGWIDHRTLAGETETLAAALSRPEGKVLAFLFCRNTIAAVTAWLALARTGHATALLDASGDQNAAARLIDAYRPEWILSAGPPPADIGSPWEAISLPCSNLTAWRLPETGPAVEKGKAETPPLHPGLCLLLATSGSTGSPKFVRLSHRAVAANTDAIIQAMAITAADRALGHLALHYSFGMSVINTHLRAGASVVLTDDSVMSGALWRTARDHACTFFPGVPFHFETIRRLGFERLRVPAITTLAQAGGRMAPDLIAFFDSAIKARSGRLFVMYGQTEAAPRLTTLPPAWLPEKLGSVGPALPGGRLEIDPAAAPTGADAGTGEVVYHGPNVMMGYAETRPDLARGDDLKGVLRTGDLGRLDADGCLFLTGRSKRIAKLFGTRVSLDDIERLAQAVLPGAVVVDGPDVVLIATADSAPDHQATLRSTLVERFKLPPAAVAVHTLAEAPRLASGKPDYAALRRLLIPAE